MDREAIEALFERFAQAFTPSEHDVTPGGILVTGNGFRVHELDTILEKHALHPKRVKGNTKHHTLDSVIAYANRHKIQGETAAYCTLADGMQPSIVVVVNDHTGPEGIVEAVAGWRDHRAAYSFPVSEAWSRWTAVTAGGSLTVGEFAALLEDGIGDLRDPAAVPNAPTLPGVTFATPAELLTLAGGLSVRIDQKVAQHQTLDNGAFQIAFTEEHETQGRDGKPLQVRNGFLLGIQVFVGGPAYAVPARLRYRVKDKQLTWQIALHDAAAIRRRAIEDSAERFVEQTQLPLFFGTPDA